MAQLQEVDQAADGRLLVHVGYHKTASTWLQESIFASQEAGFIWLGRSYEARRLIVRPNALVYSAEPVRAHFLPSIREAVQKGKVPVLSDERFSGNPHSGGFDSKEIANRLAATFPEARILIVIREQKRMIYSAYDQYVRCGGGSSIGDYLQPKSRYCVPSFDPAFFQFHRLIGHMHSLFGTERVLVLPYELFLRDPGQFLERIVSFAGARLSAIPDTARRMNEGRNAVLLALQRRLNYFLVRDDVNAQSILAIPHGRYVIMPTLERLSRAVPMGINRRLEAKMHARVAAVARGLYEESNAITSRLIGIELSELGYEVLRTPCPATNIDTKGEIAAI